MSEISEIDGCPILEVSDLSLVGTWCSFTADEHGRFADEEFTFASDRSFVWRRLNFSEDDELEFPRVEGSWLLEENKLKLSISHREDPDFFVTNRVHFAIRMRENDGQRQLVLLSTLCDDEKCEEIDGHHRLSSFPFEAHPGDADRSHRAYEAKRKKKVTLNGPFKSLIPLLFQAVPAVVGNLELVDPVFCIRLFFHDTHAPAEGYCCWVRCLTEPARQRVLREVDPINVPDTLWHPTMGIANELPEGVFEADLTSNAEIMALYAQIYALLEESADDNVPKLREALRKVCLMLHMTRWPDSVQTTDDFVIFPADGSNFFGGDYEQDMQASIPSKKLKQLARAGYLPKR